MSISWFSEIKEEVDSIQSRIDSNPNYRITEEELETIETYYLYEEANMLDD